MTPPLRIVSMGGGTGLSALLQGLKKYAQPAARAVDITAIVTVSDDGGSSGRLRREFEVLPPGEPRTSRSRSPIARIRLRPGKCLPLPVALEAIAGADLITFGPGSLFTSVSPNRLVEGMAKAIRRSQAVKAYFVNLMWQPGET